MEIKEYKSLQGDYKGTILYKEQYDFIYDWLSMMSKNKRVIRHEFNKANLKLFCERYFFYIRGDDMNQIMNEVEGVKGDRWQHNISLKHLRQLEKELDKRQWYQDEHDLIARIEKLRTLISPPLCRN